jgi:hypothetical protein
MDTNGHELKTADSHGLAKTVIEYPQITQITQISAKGGVAPRVTKRSGATEISASAEMDPQIS